MLTVSRITHTKHRFKNYVLGKNDLFGNRGVVENLNVIIFIDIFGISSCEVAFKNPYCCLQNVFRRMVSVNFAF